MKKIRMRKVGYCLLIACSIGLWGCYESPEVEVEDTIEGIWISERYDDLLSFEDRRVMMISVVDDRITIYFNIRNSAFDLPFELDGDLLVFTSEFVAERDRLTEYRITEAGDLELTGAVFGLRQDFLRATEDQLDVYKNDFLLNEYGQWRITGSDEVLLIDEGELSYWEREGILYGVRVDVRNGEPVLTAINGVTRGITHWPYELRRNQLLVGFDEGVEVLERVREDNIFVID